MGLPRWIARPVASFEMLVAILIVTRPRFGGPVAFATLFVFTLFLLRVLARTRSMGVGTVRCNCFGGAARVTGGSVVRNLALLIGAGLASTTDHLHVTLPAVLTVGMAVGTGAVLGQLAAVKSLIGQLFPKLRIDEGMTR